MDRERERSSSKYPGWSRSSCLEKHSLGNSLAPEMFKEMVGFFFWGGEESEAATLHCKQLGIKWNEMGFRWVGFHCQNRCG